MHIPYTPVEKMTLRLVGANLYNGPPKAVIFKELSFGATWSMFWSWPEKGPSGNKEKYNESTGLRGVAQVKLELR